MKEAQEVRRHIIRAEHESLRAMIPEVVARVAELGCPKQEAAGHRTSRGPLLRVSRIDKAPTQAKGTFRGECWPCQASGECRD